MTEPVHEGDPQALWQSQSVGASAMSLDEIRSKARRLERVVARRNLREYAAAVVVVGAFGCIIWVGPSADLRIGAGLIIAATVFIVWHLHVRGAAAPLSADLALKSALELHRQQLEQQRDLLRSVWWWYLLPVVPGMLVMVVGQALAHPERLSRVVAAGVGLVLVMLGIYGLNRRVAARIQRRIDRLNENPGPLTSPGGGSR